MADHIRNYTTNRVINRIVKSTYICVFRSFRQPFSVKRFSLFSICRSNLEGTISSSFLHPSSLSSLGAAVLFCTRAFAPFSFCRFACLSFRKALINPREPASNKFRLEREKQQIWVRWCQLRRMRATSYLSYFSARLLWLPWYYGGLPTRTCTHKYVHAYVLRVYVRLDKYIYKVFQKCRARFGDEPCMSKWILFFWIVTVGLFKFRSIILQI